MTVNGVASLPTYQVVTQQANQPYEKKGFLERINHIQLKVFNWICQNMAAHPDRVLALSGLAYLSITILTGHVLLFSPFIAIIFATAIKLNLDQKKEKRQLDAVQTGFDAFKQNLPTGENGYTLDQINDFADKTLTAMKEFLKKLKSQHVPEGDFGGSVELTEKLFTDYRDRLAKLAADPTKAEETKSVLHSYQNFVCRTRVLHQFKVEQLLNYHKKIAEKYILKV